MRHEKLLTHNYRIVIKGNVDITVLHPEWDNVLIEYTKWQTKVRSKLAN